MLKKKVEGNSEWFIKKSLISDLLIWYEFIRSIKSQFKLNTCSIYDIHIHTLAFSSGLPWSVSFRNFFKPDNLPTSLMSAIWLPWRYNIWSSENSKRTYNSVQMQIIKMIRYKHCYKSYILKWYMFLYFCYHFIPLKSFYITYWINSRQFIERQVNPSNILGTFKLGIYNFTKALNGLETIVVQSKTPT